MWLKLTGKKPTTKHGTQKSANCLHICGNIMSMHRARFLSLAWSKLRLCSANHRPGYWSNLPCDWPSTAWAYSGQETENGPRCRLTAWVHRPFTLEPMGMDMQTSCVCFKGPIVLTEISWTKDRFMSLARSKLRLCSANHRAGCSDNLACDWLSIVWDYSQQETENGLCM